MNVAFHGPVSKWIQVKISKLLKFTKKKKKMKCSGDYAGMLEQVI